MVNWCLALKDILLYIFFFISVWYIASSTMFYSSIWCLIEVKLLANFHSFIFNHNFDQNNSYELLAKKLLILPHFKGISMGNQYLVSLFAIKYVFILQCELYYNALNTFVRVAFQTVLRIAIVVCKFVVK